MEKPNFNQITLCVLIILLAIAIILLASINSKMQRAHQKYLTSQQLTEGIDSALGSSKLIRIMTEDVDNIKREVESLQKEIGDIGASVKSNKLQDAEKNINSINKDVNDIKQTYDTING